MNTLTNSAAVAPTASASGLVLSVDASLAERQARRQASLNHSIGQYRYSKAKPNVVMCPSTDGFRSLAAILAEEAGGSWTHRAHGYLMSKRQLEKFNKLMSDALAIQVA